MVAAPDPFPDVLARLGVGGVVEGDLGGVGAEPLVRPVGVRHRPELGADEQSLVQHGVVVLAGRADRGPDRDHQLDAHLVELADHRRRVGPLGGVELPLAEVGPVEEVADDHGQRQPAPLVLAGDLEQFLLGAVAQLALPETGSPLGKLRRVPRHVRIAPQHVGRLARGEPVVDLAGAVGHPARPGLRELHPPDRGRVPQQAVAAVGDQQRDGDLGVALDEVDDRALLVEHAVGVLAEAVEPFPFIGTETLLQPVMAVAGRGGETRPGPPEVGRLLREELGAVLGPAERQTSRERPQFRGQGAFGAACRSGR